MSPEVTTSSYVHDLLGDKYIKRNLVLVAIDEAHCITEW